MTTGLYWFQTGLDRFTQYLLFHYRQEKMIVQVQIEANIALNEYLHYLPMIQGFLVQYFYSMNGKTQWSHYIRHPHILGGAL